MAGQREEHVVERGTPDSEIVQGDTVVVETASRGQQDLGPAARRDGDPASLGIQLGRTVAEVGQESRDPAEVGGVDDPGFEHGAAGAGLKLVGGTGGDHPAPVDDDDPVREAFGLLEVLGRQHDGGAVGDQVFDERPQLVAGPRVEAGGGLIQDQYGRVSDEARAEVEASSHAARVGLHLAVGSLGERETVQYLLRPPAPFGLSDVVEQPDQFEVLPPGEHLVHGGVLAGQSDHGPQPLRVPDDVVPGDRRQAAVRSKQRCQDPHQGGLACAVRAEQAEDRAGVSTQVDPCQGVDRPESLGHRSYFDHRRCHRPPTLLVR